jgi:hypothetical protein
LWRLCVAKHLDYSAEFVGNFSRNSRICDRHFPIEHIDHGLPTKVPSLFLQRVADWPKWVSNDMNDLLVEDHAYFDVQLAESRTNLDATMASANSTSEADMDVDDDDIIHLEEQPEFCLAEVDQLMLLFRHCFDCANSINQRTVKVRHWGGNTQIKFYCSKCSVTKTWNSQSVSPSGHYTGALKAATAAVVSGIGFSVSAKPS